MDDAEAAAFSETRDRSGSDPLGTCRGNLPVDLKRPDDPFNGATLSRVGRERRSLADPLDAQFQRSWRPRTPCRRPHGEIRCASAV